MPRGTQEHRRSPDSFAYGTVTLSGRPFQCRLTRNRIGNSLPYGIGSYNPCTAEAAQVWAAPLSLATTRGMVSFPEGTEMFQFPSFPPDRLWIQRPVPRHEPGRVSPFGHPRINACTRLPEAYRSVPRPSSALGAKASTVRS